jgi:carbon-monoxide dehydrogenase medium subunit
MYPPAFAYARAHSWAEALELMGRHGPEARPLAGGQSLIPLLKLRLTTPAVLVDLGRIREGPKVGRRAGAVVVSALTRHCEAEADPILREAFPFLAREVAPRIGDPQVRHLGTVGGSLAEADPAGDWAPALIALGAEAVCARVGSRRAVPLRDFFIGPYWTALEPDELITEVGIPAPGPGPRAGVYLKAERRAGTFSTASVAVYAELGPDGRIVRAGVGLGGLAPTPRAAEPVERLLLGARPEPGLAAEAVGLLDPVTEPPSDNRGPAEYKRALGRVLLGRALRTVLSRLAEEGKP